MPERDADACISPAASNLLALTAGSNSSTSAQSRTEADSGGAGKSPDRHRVREAASRRLSRTASFGRRPRRRVGLTSRLRRVRERARFAGGGFSTITSRGSSARSGSGWAPTDGWLLDARRRRRPARRPALPYPSRQQGTRPHNVARVRAAWSWAFRARSTCGDLDNDEAVTLSARTDGPRGCGARLNRRQRPRALAEELGALPLALEQAGGLCRRKRTPRVGVPRGPIANGASRCSNGPGGSFSRDTVAVTWAGQLRSGRQERLPLAAADVLRVSAFLSADAIPYEMFAMGAPSLGAPIAEALSEHDDLAMAELLRPLARYSLIRSDHKAHTFGVHRLVQQVVRDSLSEGVARAYADRAVAAIDAALPEIGFEHWAQHDRLVAQVLATAEWITHYEVRSEAAYRILNETALPAAARPLRGRGTTPDPRALRCATRLRPRGARDGPRVTERRSSATVSGALR